MNVLIFRADHASTPLRGLIACAVQVSSCVRDVSTPHAYQPSSARNSHLVVGGNCTLCNGAHPAAEPGTRRSLVRWCCEKTRPDRACGLHMADSTSVRRDHPLTLLLLPVTPGTTKNGPSSNSAIYHAQSPYLASGDANHRVGFSVPNSNSKTCAIRHRSAQQMRSTLSGTPGCPRLISGRIAAVFRSHALLKHAT